MTTMTGRAHYSDGVLRTEPEISRKTLLQTGARVRLLRDYVTLKKGAEGVVTSVYGWIGSTQVTVHFSFNNGDTQFNQHPAAMLGIVEVLP